MSSNIRETQTKTKFKISSLEETLNQFILTTQNKFLDMKMLQNSLKQNHEEPHHSPAPSKQKPIVEQSKNHVEEPKSTPIEDEVSDETLKKWETLDKLIDKDSPFQRTKNQIINEPNPPLPDYIKPPYPSNKKKPKREIEVGQFKKFMEMLTTLQVNIPFCDALEKMSVYAKFVKGLLDGKHKWKDDEKVVLAKECSAIIQCKLPPKLTNPGSFMIHFSIGSLKIGQTLCDLGASINLMSLFMMRKLNYGEPKPTKMTLTLADRSITYPYGVLEDVLVKVDDLIFPQILSFWICWKISKHHYYWGDRSSLGHNVD
ncbi:uncharacterized protein LOC127096274 [Lathyrus oleraceus]|uniref:uncharacterized protein LOC127096274 n=1 Tax=Pisum sativum TaxID=3888 RepID=UPI0021CE4BFE|nr:uncharacterized protein LOC127096274 [Pisum sativum]